MKKLLSLSILVFLSMIISPNLFSQGSTVMGLPYEEIHSKNDIAMPYQYVREADVMWSKIIWRRIEMTEKRNHILYEPIKPIGADKSLIDVILDGIENKGLTAFEAKISDAGSEFSHIMKETAINEKMGAKIITSVTYDPDGNPDTVYIPEPYASEEIDSYLVKELWFFDKQRSVLDVRIIGICPIRKFYDEITDPDHKNPRYSKVFWIHYPELRPILAKNQVYSAHTDVKNLTYDDIFQKRYFSSFIYQQSNPYNRSIALYESGLECLLEADRVKERIFNFEQDLWEY